MLKRLLGLTILVTTMMSTSTPAADETPTISVSGSSEAFVVPDQIRLRFAVESRGGLSEATNDNAQRNGMVLSFLKSVGIKDEAVQTVSLEIDPIQFLSTKQKETEFETRIAAIRDAKKKAEAMAAELDATLQGVQAITDSARSNDYFGGDPFGGSRTSNAVAAGQMKISVGVHVVFRLANTEFE